MVLDFSLEGLPPSVNSLYATFRGRRIKSREGKAWEKAVILLFKQQLKDTGYKVEEWKDKPLRLEIELYRETWHCKGYKKKFLRVDASNHIKIAEDCLMKALGLDDSQVVDLSIIKGVGGEERTIVRLSISDG